jgi:hypothetical protein
MEKRFVFTLTLIIITVIAVGITYKKDNFYDTLSSCKSETSPLECLESKGFSEKEILQSIELFLTDIQEHSDPDRRFLEVPMLEKFPSHQDDLDLLNNLLKSIAIMCKENSSVKIKTYLENNFHEDYMTYNFLRFRIMVIRELTG